VILLGIDPGKATGWCLYDSNARRVLRAGLFPEHLRTPEFTQAETVANLIIIERPVAHGPTRPQVVECAWIAGRLRQATGAEELTRLQIKQTLTLATHGEVVVRNDATAWAALQLLHGDGCDKKGGALHGIRAHERAALAVVVAWAVGASK
jgi:hypothetical protein